eukprot:272891_1
MLSRHLVSARHKWIRTTHSSLYYWKVQSFDLSIIHNMSSFAIATWNVHGWRDSNRSSNINRVITALYNDPVDVIGFQEAQYIGIRNVLRLLRQQLHFIMTSDQTMNRMFSPGVVIASKYKITNTIMRTNDRIQLNIVQTPFQRDGKYIDIGVINVHLNHEEESIRVLQYKEMLKMIEDNDYKEMPLVLLGDFNALNRRDYDDKRWKEIRFVRQNDNWELPRHELLPMIAKSNFMDCFQIFHKGNVRNDNSTCRFDTRIDYVFANRHFLDIFEVINAQHLHHNNCSDHKMVKITFNLLV